MTCSQDQATPGNTKGKERTPRNTRDHHGTPRARRPGDDYYEELERASQRLGPGRVGLQEALHHSVRARRASATQETPVCLAERAPDTSEHSKETYSLNGIEASKETCHRGKRDLLQRQQGAEWASDEALRLVGRHRQLVLSDPLLLLQSVPLQCALNTALPLLAWLVREQEALKHQLEVELNLCKLQLIQVRLQLADARSKSLVVSKDSVCARTGNKIGTSAFVWQPDQGTVLYHRSRLPL